MATDCCCHGNSVGGGRGGFKVVSLRTPLGPCLSGPGVGDMLLLFSSSQPLPVITTDQPASSAMCASVCESVCVQSCGETHLV